MVPPENLDFHHFWAIFSPNRDMFRGVLTVAFCISGNQLIYQYVPCTHVKRPSGPRPADTERTPTHTHHFPSAQESPGRPLSLTRFFPFGRPNPSTRRRITRTARVRKPSAENRSHIQNFSFPRSSACVAYPRHTTHILAFAFTSCYHDCPVPFELASVFASFRLPFLGIMVH